MIAAHDLLNPSRHKFLIVWEENEMFLYIFAKYSWTGIKEVVKISYIMYVIAIIQATLFMYIHSVRN
jgi:hypothetical protein